MMRLALLFGMLGIVLLCQNTLGFPGPRPGPGPRPVPFAYPMPLPTSFSYAQPIGNIRGPINFKGRAEI